MDETTIDLRRSARLALVLLARCRALNGFGDDVVIHDLSPEGCRIVSCALSVRWGARVIVRPQGIEGLSGIVRWLRGHQAGIEFDRPLYPPVVEFLYRRYADFRVADRSLSGTARRLAA